MPALRLVVCALRLPPLPAGEGSGVRAALRLLFCAMLLTTTASARAESWTNQAGRVIEARLGECDGAWVTLIRTNGVRVRLPLSALSKPDQQRARLQKALSVAPAFVVAAYKDASLVLQRYASLPSDQQTQAGRNAAIQMACAVFDNRIRTRQAELKDQAVRLEVARLREQLAKGGS